MSVPESYSQTADLYAELFVDELAQHEADQAALTRFLGRLDPDRRGPVGDIGCGPARLVAQLTDLGIEALGVDGAEEMIAIARREMPDAQLARGDLGALPLCDGALGGLVARHSIIHHDPATLPAVFAEFRRVTAAGGPVLLMFSTSVGPEAHGTGFDHRVATAYRLDPDTVGAQLIDAGFTTVDVERRVPSENERFTTAAVLAS